MTVNWLTFKQFREEDKEEYMLKFKDTFFPFLTFFTFEFLGLLFILIMISVNNSFFLAQYNQNIIISELELFNTFKQLSVFCVWYFIITNLIILLVLIIDLIREEVWLRKKGYKSIWFPWQK